MGCNQSASQEIQNINNEQIQAIDSKLPIVSPTSLSVSDPTKVTTQQKALHIELVLPHSSKAEPSPRKNSPVKIHIDSDKAKKIVTATVALTSSTSPVKSLSKPKPRSIDTSEVDSIPTTTQVNPLTPKPSFTIAQVESSEETWINIIKQVKQPNQLLNYTLLTTQAKESILETWKNCKVKETSLPICEKGKRPNKEIRLFISSTFTDYFSERELLVKQIIPRLRLWCEQRNLTLVDIDLRWGVKVESTTETILRACLSELDRAKDVNGNIFFLNMLGHRYGWVPRPADVPPGV